MHRISCRNQEIRAAIRTLVPAEHRKPPADAAQHPIGRFAEPEEIANVIVFLAGSRAPFAVGANCMVSGGDTCI